MHRRHDAASARKAVHMARAAGFRQPDPRPHLRAAVDDPWRSGIANLQEALDLGIEHLSGLPPHPRTGDGIRSSGRTRPASSGRRTGGPRAVRMAPPPHDRSRIRTLRNLQFRPSGSSGRAQQQLLVRRGPIWAWVRRPTPTTGKRLRRWNCADLRRYLTEMPPPAPLRNGNPQRYGPLQRIPHDPSAHRSGGRSSGAVRYVRPGAGPSTFWNAPTNFSPEA